MTGEKKIKCKGCNKYVKTIKYPDISLCGTCFNVNKRNEERKKEIINKYNPNENGISEWIPRCEFKNKPFKYTDNGNNRCNRPPWDNLKRSIFEYEFKRNGQTVTYIRTVEYCNKDIKNTNRKIKPSIKKKLLKKYKRCINCSSNQNLVIDHKNDLYNNPLHLDFKTQNIEHFQVLCNHCNNNVKFSFHQIAKKTGKLPYYNNMSQYFKGKIYPWEKAIRKYDENNIHCKLYTYWYDICEFKRKMYIYDTVTVVYNRFIKSYFKNKK